MELAKMGGRVAGRQKRFGKGRRRVLNVVAVGQRVPDWAQAAWDDYAKRLPPELRLELKAVKTELRGSRTLPTLLAAERERIEAAIPKGARVVVSCCASAL